MVIVVDSDEWLYLGPDLHLLLAHALSDGAWVSVDPGDESVGVLLVWCTVIVVLYTITSF